jgi:hypothetical protein
MEDATNFLVLQQLESSEDEAELELDDLVVCFWGLVLAGKEVYHQWKVEKHREQ